MKRLIIYQYSENSGIVGEATSYLLNELKKTADRLVIVGNAYLTAQGRKELKKITDDFYCLNCKNIIQVAYADAIVNYCGLEDVRNYDEVILMNDNVWGPISSLSDIFDMMSERNCDYWQMSNLLPKQDFIALRSSFINRDIFVDFLNYLMGVYRRTFQNIGKSKYSDKAETGDIYEGVTGDSYILLDKETEKLSELDMSLYMIQEKGYPFWNKEILNISYFDAVRENGKYGMASVIQYIQDNNLFDFDLISREQVFLAHNMKTFDEKMQNANLYSGKIYIDYGQGYSELSKFLGYNFFNDNGDFMIKFSLETEGNIVGFRYDPIEAIPNLAMTLYSCKCDGVELSPSGSNSNSVIERFQLFDTLDPYYEFSLRTNKIKEIIIEGNMLFVNNQFMENLRSCAISTYISNIFWDDGNGFNESNKITKGLFLDSENEFELRFSRRIKPVKAIRFDPIEGFKCSLQLLEVLIDGSPVNIKGGNGLKIGKNKWMFNTFDPNLIFEIQKEDVEYIYIRGKMDIR